MEHIFVSSILFLATVTVFNLKARRLATKPAKASRKRY
jgi:hypothetical protein